ncbi:MAG: hypothetical protein WCT18_05040 [Patescibacteria group bacterium]
MKLFFKKLSVKVVPLSSYFFIVLAVVLPWFIKSGYLFFVDQSWGPIVEINWQYSSFLLSLITKTFSFFGSVAFFEKIYITLVLGLILFFGKSLIEKIAKLFFRDGLAVNKKLIFVLSLFSLSNPFVYDRALYGQVGVLAAYGFLLLTASLLLEAWKNLDCKKIIFSAVSIAFCLMFAMNFIFFLGVFYLIFITALYFKNEEILKSKLGLKIAGSLLFSIAIIFLININWLLPIFLGSSSTVGFVKDGISTQDLMAFQTSGKTAVETIKNVIFMSGFWGKDQFRYVDLTKVAGWGRSFFFLLPIIFYGIWLSFYKRSRNEKIFSGSLIFVYVLSILLAVGIKAPVAREISMFFYNHLPFYMGLREPQKWVAVIIPIYLFYLTFGVVQISKFKIIEKNKFLSGIILAGIIIMQAPGLLWGFGGQVKPTNYPPDWTEINNIILQETINKKDCQDKIIFLPWHMYMSFQWIGKVVANPAPHFFSCPVISGTNMEWGGIYDNSQNLDGNKVGEWLKNEGETPIPQVSNDLPKYIILAKEVDWQKYGWLNNLQNLEKIKETKTLILYEFIY